MANFYDTDRAVSEYLLFHYGEQAKLLPWEFGPHSALNYPLQCVSECLDLDRLPENVRALDLGCAVGRSTFELARHCHEVIGIDYSQKFVDAGNALVRDGEANYSFTIEGDLREPGVAVVDEEIDRKRVAFEQGDACDLRDNLAGFDVVLMANLLCRLQDPAKCLARLSGLLNPGGQLLIMTPCTWLEEYTPRENWLGGIERAGAEVRTLDSLKSALNPDFTLDHRTDLPFLIREHERKFQWTVAEATRWIRR
ncbi:MAG: putative 4-mercaptohistidine N1-methyltransferase [Verrucomicrobiales bacterium]|nr:putative 4-mercaptohistidine N1-methyltransferase [Verrucomicrobiales bacterium]